MPEQFLKMRTIFLNTNVYWNFERFVETRTNFELSEFFSKETKNEKQTEKGKERWKRNGKTEKWRTKKIKTREETGKLVKKEKVVPSGWLALT